MYGRQCKRKGGSRIPSTQVDVDRVWSDLNRMRPRKRREALDCGLVRLYHEKAVRRPVQDEKLNR